MARGKDKNKDQEQNKGVAQSHAAAHTGGRDYCITVCAHCSSVPSLISLYMPFASDLSTCSDSVTTS